MKTLKKIIGYILNPIGMLITRHNKNSNDKVVTSYAFICLVSLIITALIIFIFYFM